MPANSTKPLPIRLFLSYGRRDASELASRLRDDLDKLGYEVWQHTLDVLSGEKCAGRFVGGQRSTKMTIAQFIPRVGRCKNISR